MKDDLEESELNKQSSAQDEEKAETVEESVDNLAAVEAENSDTAADEILPEEIPTEEPAEKASDLIGYDDDEAVEEDKGVATTADHIIDAFSIESIVGGTVRLTHIPSKIAEYVIAAAYIILGGVCIGYPFGVEVALPYLVGGVMAVLSLGQFIIAIVQKEYRTEKSNKTASSVIYLVLSIFILAQPEWAHEFIPTVWGVLGLFEAAHAFNIAVARISKGRQPAYYIIKGIVEAVVAFLLLYRPEEYAQLHIIVFGISLVLDGVTTIPILKKFLTGM